MRIRVVVPLPGPFVLTSGGRKRKPSHRKPADPAAVVLGVLVFVACVAVFLVSWFGGHANAAGDPGETLATDLRAAGASLPSGWGHNADTIWHDSICAEYARDYADYPAGYVDENGVTKAMARAAVVASNFCGG